MTGSMQPYEQPPAHRIARRPIRLPPLPDLAQGQRQRAAAQARRRGEESPNRRQVHGRDRAAAIGERDLHVRERTKFRRRTQVQPARLPGSDLAPGRRGIAGRWIATHDQALQLMRFQRRRGRPASRPPPKAPTR